MGDTSIPLPRRIGPYKVVSLLGAGGMGAVYKARAADGQLVAVKVVRPEYAGHPEFRARFQREAAAARKVPRYWTAQVLGAHLDDGLLYLVTEFIDGPTLQASVQDSGPWPPADLEQLGVSVATALTAIHDAGVVHRDLKPGNVLLSRSGPRVIDFGIAQALDVTAGLTNTGQVLGTPAFMAPEQYRGHAVTPAVDVFAWGGILVFAATGRLPFGGGSAHALAYRVVHEEPDLTGLDGRLRAAAAAALDKDPAARPGARELAGLLDSAGTVVAAPRPAAAERTAGWAPREPPARPPGKGPAAPPGGRPAPPPGALPGVPTTPATNPAAPAPRPGWSPRPGSWARPGWWSRLRSLAPRAVAFRLAVALVTAAVITIPVRGLLDRQGASGAADVELARGGEYSVAIGEPLDLLPSNTYDADGVEVLNALYTPLVTYDPETMRPEMGGVAESVQTTDQQVWTITLKQGWTFHNGEPVTAQSYVDSWNFAAYGPNDQLNGYLLDRVEGFSDVVVEDATELRGLEAPDARTLQVTLSEPFSQFPLLLGVLSLAPLPSSVVQEVMRAEAGDERSAALAAYGDAPIGNGPFQIDGEWVHDQAIRVTRFEDYQGTPAYADAIEFRIYTDIGDAATDLAAGTLDVISHLARDEVANAEDQLGERHLTQPSSTLTYLGLPLDDERFQDLDLRRALSLAIDRQEITGTILRSTAEPAGSLASEVVAGAREDPCGQWCDHAPERAQELLEQAGGWDGPLTIWYNSDAGQQPWVEAVAAQWRETLGIQDIQLEPRPFSEHLAALTEDGATGPFRMAWALDYPSAQNLLESVFLPDSFANYSGYDNPVVTDLIAQANAAGSVEAGTELLQQAEDIVLSDLPVIPLWFDTVHTAHSERVTNVAVDAFGRIRTAGVALVEPDAAG